MTRTRPNSKRHGASQWRWSRSRACACLSTRLPCSRWRGRQLEAGVPLTEIDPAKGRPATRWTTIAFTTANPHGRCLPPIDHPGTGPVPRFRHRAYASGSAKNRKAMHEQADAELTDSMKMFRWGVEGGRPGAGQDRHRAGMVLQGHRHDLARARRAARSAVLCRGRRRGSGDRRGLYHRRGGAAAAASAWLRATNLPITSFEKRNYLNLAGSKIRNCSLGPELVIDPDFKSVPGEVSIERAGKCSGRKRFAPGRRRCATASRNIEHHHFKFRDPPAARRCACALLRGAQPQFRRRR